MGIFKCDKHDFTTDEPKDWREHMAQEEHTTRGKAPCNQCDIVTEFIFNGKVGEKAPSLCQKCREKLLVGTVQID